ATLATDNFEAGVLQGQYARKALGDKAPKLAMLDGTPGGTVDTQRHDGFLKGFGIKESDPANIASFGALSPSAFLAYWPWRTPASKLSVASVASTASAGSVAVSRAMTRMPLSRAFLTAPSTPVELFGVIRMPLTPALMKFSIAATCPSLSPSNLPNRATSFAP